MKLLLDVPDHLLAEVDQLVKRNNQERLYMPQSEDLRKARDMDGVTATQYIGRVTAERQQKYPRSRTGVLQQLIIAGFTHFKKLYT